MSAFLFANFYFMSRLQLSNASEKEEEINAARGPVVPNGETM